MNCKQIEILLSDYIDNKTSVNQSKQIQSHIELCNNCNLLYKRIKASSELLKPTKEISEPSFYYTKLKQRMESNLAKENSFYQSIFVRKIIQPAIYLTSIILAVYIGILIGSNSNSTNQYANSQISDKSYTEIFIETQLMNDFDIELIENNYLNLDSTKED